MGPVAASFKLKTLNDSPYLIDLSARLIYIRPKSGRESFSFGDFQQIFLHSAILMNKMENYQEKNHNIAVNKNTALIEPFMTPDGVLVQVFGKMVQRGDKMHREFRLVKR